MATQLNPFHVGFDRGKRRTLAEIEAATKGFNTLRSQLARPPPVQPKVSTKVADWLSTNFMNLDGANHFRSNRRTPILILNDDEEPSSERPPNQHAVADPLTNTSSGTVLIPPSSRYCSANRLKRKASQRDDHEEDVIIVRAPSRIPRRAPWFAEVVDLTEPDQQKRRMSFLGNQDDDVMIIEPPAAEIRRDLRPLVLGKPSDLDTRPNKRLRQTLAEAQTANLELSLRRDPEAEASEANAAEVSALLESVEPLTHFFTLATEIREKIYRHLLVSSKPIHVQRLWTELARRPSRRGGRRGQNDLDVEVTIETQILRVCRRTALEGTRILYSENSFLYQLRDPEVLENKVASARKTNRTTRSQKKQRTIDLAKYGHLIRHMAIELEPNRTGLQYQDLMAAALDTLVSPSAGVASPRVPMPLRQPCGHIHLHTLTITVSPLFESNRRTVRPSAPGDQDVTIKDGRFLSVVSFFSRGATVVKALQRINANFLRINVHANSDAKNRRSRPEISDDEDSEPDSESEGTSTRPEKPRPRHLETTLDLRFLPRHMGTLWEGPIGNLWENDALMPEKRRQQGVEAEAALANLRKHIEEACLKTEGELRRGLWEEHGNAERRRREKRARDEAKFDGDAYDDKDGVEEGDGRGLRGMKSLIISIARIGGELRVYRP